MHSPAPILLDVHAHLAPIDAAALASMDGVEWRADRGELVLDGHVVGMKPLFRPESLVAWMDEQGVATAWISIPPPLYRQQLDANGAGQWARYVNDGLAAIAGRYPGRLAPLRHLPLEHPALARRIASAGTGHEGFAVAAGGRDVPVFSDPGLAPVWQALDAAGSFVFVHPGNCCDDRLGPFYLENLLGNPYETAVAIAHVVFGGIHERFPGIRFCFAHGGGAAAMLAGRFQRGYDTQRPGVDPALAAPRAVLRGLYVDCIVHDAAALALAAETFGADHILFGSDWPFPMGLPRPHEQLAGVERSLQAAIFGRRII